MDKVPGKGVMCGSDVDEEKSDLKPMPSCAPNVCGMEGSTIIELNEGPALDE